MRLNNSFIIIITLIFAHFGQCAFAQEIEPQEITQEVVVEYEDSVIYVPKALVDTLLNGKDIFQELPSQERNGADATVSVHQDNKIRSAFFTYVAKNASRPIDGYRIRVYFDNNQNARAESEQTRLEFSKSFPGITAYRSYVNPYFKVTVGDFRTRAEAMQDLNSIKQLFPSAFIVNENIKYPVIDKNETYTTDTLKIIKTPMDAELISDF